MAAAAAEGSARKRGEMVLCYVESETKWRRCCYVPSAALMGKYNCWGASPEVYKEEISQCSAHNLGFCTMHALPDMVSDTYKT